MTRAPRRAVVVLAGLSAVPWAARADDSPDLAALGRIRDLGKTQSTDHISFDAVGLPGFQFIQDELEYRGTPGFEFFGTHHTNMDVFDRLQRDDLMQAAVVMASFVYQAAMREERLPRKPLPR
jgi:hypothetical protein